MRSRPALARPPSLAVLGAGAAVVPRRVRGDLHGLRGRRLHVALPSGRTVSGDQELRLDSRGLTAASR